MGYANSSHPRERHALLKTTVPGPRVWRSKIRVGNLPSTAVAKYTNASSRVEPTLAGWLTSIPLVENSARNDRRVAPSSATLDEKQWPELVSGRASASAFMVISNDVKSEAYYWP